MPRLSCQIWHLKRSAGTDNVKHTFMLPGYFNLIAKAVDLNILNLSINIIGIMQMRQNGIQPKYCQKRENKRVYDIIVHVISLFLSVTHTG